ncbi:MAG: STAS/SEC14 domain-containing protein [Phormidesmis sp. CAN_BIN36]|nr:STAS/SEC14 domain-containing protein [Phormidesmis sp. CAN_BIN36]
MQLSYRYNYNFCGSIEERVSRGEPHIMEKSAILPKAPMSLDELIQAASQLDETDLDRLLHQVVVLRAHRKAHALPEQEAQLLHKINQGIDPELRAQYQILRAKREAETLTDAEYNTLIQLSNQIEQLGAQRLEALANLAQLRQVSLSELMETLGIQPVTDV